jgi:hypothetical protein
MKKFLISLGFIFGLTTPSFSAMWYAKTAGNWDATSAWNSQSDGAGTDTTAPLPSTDTAHLNGKAMNLNVDVVISSIQAAGATGTLTVVSSHSITGNIAYGGTLTTGMLVVPTGTFLTVYGMVISSAAGYAIVTAGASGVTVSSANGIALYNTSSGRSLYASGTGWFYIQGNINDTGGGYTIYNDASSSTHTIVGNIFCSDANGGGIRTNSGTIGISGNLSSASNGRVLLIVGAPSIITWTGVRTLATGTDCQIVIAGGTLNITSLVLANSGRVLINYTTGTLTVGSGATLAKINNQTHDAQAVVLGGAYDIINPFSTGGGGGSFTFAQ